MCVKHLLNVHLARLFAVPLLGALVVFALTPAVGADEAASSAQIKQWLEKADHASQALRHVAAQVRPSVVAVNTTFASPAGRVLPGRRDPLAEALRDFFGQEYFERFFQDRRPGEGIPFPLRGQQRHGQASGLIISADGHIVTNERAVRGAEAVSVQLHDGRKLPAEIVGVDRKFDLAVLRIKAKNLQPAKLGDSNSAQLFDWGDRHRQSLRHRPGGQLRHRQRQTSSSTGANGSV